MSGEGGSGSCSDSLLVSSPRAGAEVDASTASGSAKTQGSEHQESYKLMWHIWQAHAATAQGGALCHHITWLKGKRGLCKQGQKTKRPCCFTPALELSHETDTADDACFCRCDVTTSHSIETREQ